MRGVATAERVRAFLTALGRAASQPATVYLVGGTSAVIEGWRDSTVDIDLRLTPDRDELMRAIASLKNTLDVNVEFASPDLFIPVAAGWEERSPWVTDAGKLTVRHFDLTAQALAKISRGHARDMSDLAAMLERGLVTRGGIATAFATIRPDLYRFPAIDEPSFADAVARATEADR